MNGWRVWAPSLIFGLVVSDATAAEPTPTAQPRRIRVSLVWDAPADLSQCMSAGAIERGVEAMLERPVFARDEPAGAVIRGSLACANGTCTAHLVMTRADGQLLGVRDLRTKGQSCEELSDATEVVLAVAIDSVETEVVALALPRRSSETWRGWLAPMAFTSYGRFPRASIGLGFGGRIEPPVAWPVDVAFFEWMPMRVDDGGRGASFAGWQAQVSVCPAQATAEHVAVQLCAGGSLSRMKAEGYGFDVTRGAEIWVPSLLAQALVLLPLSRRFVVELPIGAELPLIRPDFVHGIQGVNVSFHRSSVIFLTAGVGFGIRMP